MLTMIELKQIGNDYYLNGVKGNYMTFNMTGIYKTKSYYVYIDEKGQIIRVWKFYGKLK